MALDENGIYKYTGDTPVNTLEGLLNLGMSSVSNQVQSLREQAYFGTWLTVPNRASVSVKVDEAKRILNLDATPARPMFFYLQDSKVFATWDGTTLFRVGGGELYRYQYLTSGGNRNGTAGATISLGNTSVSLPAAAFTTLSLSALLLPEGGASGNFHPIVNGQRIAPNASWTSYGTNSRMSLWFTWVVRMKEGTNNVEWKYSHGSGNSGAKTIISTVHAWVRY